MKLSLGGVRVASLLATHLPDPVVEAAAATLGRAAARFSPDQRLIVERNMRRVRGADLSDEELESLVSEVFASYARYWADSLRLASLDPDSVDRGFSYEGLHHLTDPVARGIGPICAMPHLGGWEWAARWLTEIGGFGVAAVAERLDPPELFDWFVEYRRGLGIEVIPLGPDAPSALGTAIADGSIIALLCDRDLTGDGIEVEFFGERTTLPGGPALMALRTGAPLCPGATYFDDDHVHAVVRPALDTDRRGRLRHDVERVTQVLATELEILISAAPEQWHLMQPNWPSDHEALARSTRPADVAT